MRQRNPYAVLGVPADATDERIAKRYRELTFAHHPDRNPGDAGAQARMAAINAAYDDLKTPERRAALDRELQRELQRSQSPWRTALENVRDILKVTHDFFTRDPVGKAVASGIHEMFWGQEDRGQASQGPRATPSPEPPGAAMKRASRKKSASTASPATKKGAAKKTASKKTAQKKGASTKTAAKKTAAKKTAAKKTAAKKTAPRR